MQEYRKERDCLYFSGVAMAEYSISLPISDFGYKGDEKINETFTLLFENAKKSVEKLYEKAKTEYENDGDEKKRFHHRPYRYTLSCDVKDCEGEYFSFILSSTVQLRAKIISEKKNACVMRKSDGKVIPFSIVYGKGTKKLKRKLRKEKGLRDFSNFYLLGGKIHILLYKDGRWQSMQLGIL